MPEISDNKDGIRQAFQKVKDEILDLKAEIGQNKGVIESLRKEISELRVRLQEVPKELISIGNDGVSKHAVSIQEAPSKHPITKKEPKIEKNDFVSFFSELPQYEFKTFLVVYQLDEENGRANYYEISSKLGVSYGCAGGYISSLLRKKAPLVKTKLNKNRTVISIDPIFKSLNPYEKLLELYYQKFRFDSDQAKITSF